MTFTDSPQKLWNAIQADLTARDARKAKYEKLIEAFEGKDGAPSNHCYEYATLVGPQIVFRNPRVSVTSRVPGIMTSMRVGMRCALEAEQQRQHIAEIWEQTVQESFFWEGITHVTVDDDRTRQFSDGQYLATFSPKEDGEGMKLNDPKEDGSSSPRPGKFGRRPVMSRIDPMDFVIDAANLGARHARRMGHRYFKTRSELKDLARHDESWDMEAIDNAAIYERSKRTDDESSLGESEDEMIEVWSIWLPGHYPSTPEGIKARNDRSYNGSLATLSNGGSGGVQLREDRLFFGPQRGPYQRFEGTPIPSKSYRLAPLMATDNQRKAHAASGRTLMRAIKAFKRMIVVANATVARKIRSVGNDHIVDLGIPPDKVRSAVAEVTQGGLTTEMIAGHQFLTDQKDEASGINENKRGRVTGGTATEADIANRAGELRVTSHRENCHRACAEGLSAMAWYIFMDPKVVIPLPFEAIKELGIADDEVPPGVGLMYQGGDGAKLIKSGTVFEDLSVSIEPFSMERTNEGLQMKRILEMVGMIERIALLEEKTGGRVLGSELADYAGSQLNNPGIGKFLQKMQAPEGGQGGNMPPNPQPGGGPASGTAPPGNAAGAQAAQAVAP